MHDLRAVVARGPIRVVVDAYGRAVSLKAALAAGVKPWVVFVRRDRWSLGAPMEYAAVAYRMWENEWAWFYYFDEGTPEPIGNWRLR